MFSIILDVMWQSCLIYTFQHLDLSWRVWWAKRYFLHPPDAFKTVSSDLWYIKGQSRDVSQGEIKSIKTWHLQLGPPSLFTAMHLSLAPLDLQRRAVRFQGLRPPKHTYFTSRYSLIPYFEPSTPRPDCLTPPNEASGVDRRPSLIPTIPTSNASATRQIWLTSCE